MSSHVSLKYGWLLRTHSDLVCLGNVNCCPTKSTVIQDICEIYGCTNLITEPTCHKSDISTLLGVIRVTNPHKYLGNLNSECNISDFHNITGAATRRFAPSLKHEIWILLNIFLYETIELFILWHVWRYSGVLWVNSCPPLTRIHQRQSCMSGQALLHHWLCNQKHPWGICSCSPIVNFLKVTFYHEMVSLVIFLIKK